jgi:hypothetical protein
MIDVKKVYEDAVVAAGEGATASDVQASAVTSDSSIVKQDSRVSDTDVLGKCDHSKEGGYMKDGCFHLPSRALKLQKREILAGKKKKCHKNDYAKGMEVLVSEAELDRQTIIAIHKLSADKLLAFVQDQDPSATEVICIAYCMSEQAFIIKFRARKAFRYILAVFDGRRFVGMHGRGSDALSMTADEVKRHCKLGPKGMQMWTVWGGDMQEAVMEGAMQHSYRGAAEQTV